MKENKTGKNKQKYTYKIKKNCPFTRQKRKIIKTRSKTKQWKNPLASFKKEKRTYN